MLPSPQAVRRRMRPGSWAVPRSLVVLLVIVAIVGLCWALLTPPWQTPDAIDHYAYTQSIAQGFRLPGNKHKMQRSSDENVADYAVGASIGAFYPEASPPDWNAGAYRAYLKEEHSADPPSRSNGGGPNPASTNPPLYYLFASVGYLIDDAGTAFGRLYAIQLWGLLLLLATTIGAWLLAGETFGPRRSAQLTTAAVVGLLPMTTFISASVNPDAMMITIWTFALWLGARVINREAQAIDCTALCALTAAGVLTKATSYALVVPVVVALLLGWFRRPQADRRRAARTIGISALALVLPILGWLVLAHVLGRPAVNQINSGTGSEPFNVRQFLSYLWQFYLPRLSFMSQFRETPVLPVYDIWLKEGTGVFGWVSVLLPSWMYLVGPVLLGVISVAAAALLTQLRSRRQLALLSFYALTMLALLALLHITDYRSIIAGQGPILQGRYLLPVVGLLGLAAGLIVVKIPLRWRASASGLSLAGLLVGQTLSLVAILEAFYR
jgi:4-amino-4-deoxy-L-arabinose transferase-like glycosyltransferase